MAKVCLLDSPSWLLFDPRAFLHLGILYLGGALKAAGHDVRVLDCHDLTSWNPATREFSIHQDKLPECDVVGISATTANVHWGREMAKVWPAKYKVLGGSHSSYIVKGPHERFKRPQYFEGFDYLMVEECEEAFIQFCDTVDKGVEPKKQFIPPIFNLCWFDGAGKLIRNPVGPNPDVTKQRPAFELWEGQFFQSGFQVNSKSGKTFVLKDGMTASLYTARGCPYGCTFCADARTKVREETPEQIEAEVRQLAEMGVRAIRVQDDVLTIKASRCKLLADIFDAYGMKWRGNTRVNLTDPELFRYMAKKGCTELGFGCESGSKVILDAMQKGTTPEKNTEGVHMAQDAGMACKAFLMLGFCNESKETIAETTDWVLKTKPDMASCALFQPFPGSAVWNNPEKFGVTLPDAAFEKFWQQGLDDDPAALILDLPFISKTELLQEKRAFCEMLDREIGHRDRSRLDSGGPTGLGTFVSEAMMN